MKYTHESLRKTLKYYKYPDRSRLTTKNDMANAILEMFQSDDAWVDGDHTILVEHKKKDRRGRDVPSWLR